jgi:exodeoxyribonuclease VII small subunit
MPAKSSKSSIADFEKQFAELEKIVNRMEGGQLSLDESLADFEKGMALCSTLREALAQAEQKVQILVRENSTDKLAPFESADESAPDPQD